MIDQRLIEASAFHRNTKDMQKIALASGLNGRLVKLANLGKVHSLIQSGMKPAEAVRKAYPNYTPAQVASYLQSMSKSASVEDLEKVAVLGWLARQAILRGGGRASKAGERYLLRRSARKGRLENLAQRKAATEAGKTDKYIARSSRQAGRKPVMDQKREIAALQQQAAQRFAQPSAMEKLRMRMPGSGQAESAMARFGTRSGGHGGPGLGKRDMVGRYLQGGPGRRGIIAGGMDAATALGQGVTRLARGTRGGLRSARDRALLGPRRPELSGQRMYAGNREAQLMRGGLLTGALGGGGAMMV